MNFSPCPPSHSAFPSNYGCKIHKANPHPPSIFSESPYPSKHPTIPNKNPACWRTDSSISTHKQMATVFEFINL